MTLNRHKVTLTKNLLIVEHEVSSFPRATLSNYLVVDNNRDLFSHSSKDQKPEIKVLAEPLFLHRPWEALVSSSFC